MRGSDSPTRPLGRYADKAVLSGVPFAQLRVFDDPTRDDRGWVLSVGHSAALAADRLPGGVRLCAVVGGRPIEPLLFDHAAMVTLAVEQLRLQYAAAVDPSRLLDETFTVLALRRVYQAVYGRPLLKDTFRRYVIDAIEPTGETAGAFGRPAELFRRRAGALLPPSAWAFFVGDGQGR